MNIPQKIQEVYEKSTCLYTLKEIETSLDKMAVKIHRELADKNPVLLCVMIGGLVLMGNLLPRLDFPLEVDYLHVTRYQGAIKAGNLEWIMKPRTDLTHRTVLIVDDILDGGLTLSAIIAGLKQSQVREIFTAVLVDKHHQREEGGLKKADFVGLEVADHYIFGYGMDYHNYLRNAPGIFVVAPEHE